MRFQTQTFQATWPVTDDSLNVAQLIERHAAKLPTAAEEAGLVLVGKPRWRTAEVEEFPGHTQEAKFVVLVADTLARKPPRKCPRVVRLDPDEVRHLVEDGWTDGIIAQRMGCTRDTVIHARRIHGIPAAGYAIPLARAA